MTFNLLLLLLSFVLVVLILVFLLVATISFSPSFIPFLLRE
jgi:hypothetical protein